MTELKTAHREEVNRLKEEFTAKMQEREDAHNKEQTRMREDGLKARKMYEKTLDENKQEHFAELMRVTNEKDARIAALTEEMNKMRLLKDAEIVRLDTRNEDRRLKDNAIYRSNLETIRQQEKDIAAHLKTIAVLTQELDIRKDFERQYNEALARCESLQVAKQALQQELTNAGEYILELEAKFLKSQETCIELLTALKNCEFELEAALQEIATLKQYIIDLKARIAVYIPVKGDVVDRKLAEYINNFPDRQKLKIMFMRESDGVYQFGTKKVHVRVDKDKINVRVGGGYLSIDEFLDQYTPQELEKLERKDPLKRFNEKVAV
jgi:DNA repair exonuclease SbcCD ATPase subunit